MMAPRLARLTLALVVSASVWFYVDYIFVPSQVIDQAKEQTPRGNLSDLYPRWLGARELLLHGRNPYGDDIARESQIGYYGRVLDHSRPTDPEDREAFAYPVYVVFLLAPFVHLSFHNVQWTFHWILLALTASSAVLWLRALRWRLSGLESLACSALLISSVPGLQAIKLQQLTLLVAALLAGAAAAVVGRQLVLSGVLLAVSTIKPQLAWPLVLWLMVWTLGDWRRRRKLAISFGSTMAVLLVGAEWILPGWLRMFIEAIHQYHQYTHNLSVLDADFGLLIGPVVAAAALLASAWQLWKLRKPDADHPTFSYALALVMALTVLIVPMIAPYNQVLLLPTVLYLLRRGCPARPRAFRFAYAAWALVLAMPWVASLLLSAVYFVVSPAAAMSVRKLPFLTTLSFPLLIFALIFAISIVEPPPRLAEPGSAL
jgi:hypothetical protein